MSVRLRITGQPDGCVDGIHLDKLIVGFVYEVGTTLGCYLLAQGVAEPVDEDVPAHVPPWSETRFSLMKPADEPPPVITPTVLVDELNQAADKRRPRRKRS